MRIYHWNNEKLSGFNLAVCVMAFLLIAVPGSALLAGHAFASDGGEHGDKGNATNASTDHRGSENETSDNANSTSATENSDNRNQTNESDSNSQSNQTATNSTSSENRPGKHGLQDTNPIGHERAMLVRNVHSIKNETFADWYHANMTFSLSADGKALVMSNHSRIDAQNASLSVSMSVWKTWKSLVWMKVDNGTIKIGNNVTEIHGGHAYFLKNHSRLVLTGFVRDNTANTTSSGEYDNLHGALRIHAFSSSGRDIPMHGSSEPVHLTMMGMDSTPSWKWFLAMKGELSLSS